MNLITLADVQLFSPSVNASQVCFVLSDVSRKVEAALGRAGVGLGYWSGTERVASAGGSYLRLARYPLVSIESISYGDDPIDDWERYVDGDRWGVLRRESGGRWPASTATAPLTGDLLLSTDYLEVEYSAGYRLPGQSVPAGVSAPDLPGDIRMACVELVLNKLGRGVAELSGKHVSEERLGDMSIRYGTITAQTSAANAERRILTDLAAAYRRPWCP